DGRQAGRPAVTRRAVEQGSAAYVSTRLGAAGIRPLLERLLAAAGVPSELPAPLRGRVELAVRRTTDEEFWFLVNRTDEALGLTGADGKVLVSTTPHDGDAAADRPAADGVLAPRGVVVLRRPRL